MDSKELNTSMHKQWSCSAAWWEVKRWRVRYFKNLLVKEEFAYVIPEKKVLFSRKKSFVGRESVGRADVLNRRKKKSDLTCRSDQRGLSERPLFALILSETLAGPGMSLREHPAPRTCIDFEAVQILTIFSTKICCFHLCIYFTC